MSTTTRWTSADLESLPDDGNRYEIIDGELYMSKQPHFLWREGTLRGFGIHLKEIKRSQTRR